MARRIRLGCSVLVCVLLGGLPQDIASEVIRVSGSTQLRRAIARAEPGTKILLTAGTYRGGISAGRLRGTAGKPIVIAAADPADPPLIEGGTAAFHLSDPAYVELHHLVIRKCTGNGINIDDGGSYATPAHHVTLKGLVVRDIGPRGNRDGLKLSGLDDFLVEDCVIERWGSSGSGIDMVGCHRGKVTSCRFRHTSGIEGTGVQMKGGSRGIVVSRCRFEQAGGRAVNVGGSTGLAYFRPKPERFEAREITVEDCTFTGSMAAVAFVGVDGADVRHNVIYRPTRWVTRILQETTSPGFVPCRRGRFTNNIVVFRSNELRTAVNVGSGTAAETFSFSGNVWYCEDRPAASRPRLPVRETGGLYGRDPGLRDPARGDFRPTPNGPARSAGVRPASKTGR